MNFNIKKIVLFIKTKGQFNGCAHTLDDILIMSISGYKDVGSDTVECCLIDKCTFKKLISYILVDKQNKCNVLPLDDKNLKYIYLTLNKTKVDNQKRSIRRQINMLKECIVTKRENEIICASMY